MTFIIIGPFLVRLKQLRVPFALYIPISVLNSVIPGRLAGYDFRHRSFFLFLLFADHLPIAPVSGISISYRDKAPGIP